MIHPYETPGRIVLWTVVDLLVTVSTLALTTVAWHTLAQAWQPAIFSATVIVLVGWDMLIT
jgi:hypothetical protein